MSGRGKKEKKGMMRNENLVPWKGKTLTIISAMREINALGRSQGRAHVSFFSVIYRWILYNGTMRTCVRFVVKIVTRAGKRYLLLRSFFSFFFSFFPINLATSVANSCSTRRIPRCHDTFISSYHEKLEIEVVNRVSTRSKADDFFETFEFISLSNFSSRIFPRIVN